MSEDIRFNEELVKRLKKSPFSPFVVILASGDRYEVTDPIQVAIGESVVVVVPPGSTHVFFRKNQIVGVEVRQTAA